MSENLAVDLAVEVKKLQEELKAFKTETLVELHQVQRQQSSRRGLEGPRGLPGVGIKGDKGDVGTVSKEQAIALFREVVNDIFKDETLKSALKDMIAGEVTAEVAKGGFRLVRKTAAEKN